jgi:hypothetical protein
VAFSHVAEIILWRYIHVADGLSKLLHCCTVWIDEVNTLWVSPSLTLTAKVTCIHMTTFIQLRRYEDMKMSITVATVVGTV